jgi:hypothetical protein
MSRKRKAYKKPRVISGKVFDSSFACLSTISWFNCVKYPKTVGCGSGGSSSVCYRT